jgi:hypothetical protein
MRVNSQVPTIKWGVEQGEADAPGWMGLTTMETGKKIKEMARVFSKDMTGISTLGVGRMIRKTAQEMK